MRVVQRISAIGLIALTHAAGAAQTVPLYSEIVTLPESGQPEVRERTVCVDRADSNAPRFRSRGRSCTAGDLLRSLGGDVTERGAQHFFAR